MARAKALETENEVLRNDMAASLEQILAAVENKGGQATQKKKVAKRK